MLPSEDLPSLSYAGIIWGIGDNTIVESTTIQHFLGLMQQLGATFRPKQAPSQHLQGGSDRSHPLPEKPGLALLTTDLHPP